MMNLLSNLRVQRNRPSLSRRYFSAEKRPNLIQQMPEYQEALKLAVDKKYPESV